MRFATTVAFLALLPAAAPAQDEPAPAPAASALAERTFTTPSGIRGTVDATAAPEVEAGDGWERLTIPIGTRAPIVCFLYPKRVDGGDVTRRAIEAVAKEAKILRALPVEVSTDGGNPVLFTETVYQQGADARGLFKVAVHPHHTRSAYCFHDEPGSETAFRRTVKGLVASLEGAAEDPHASARFVELTTFRVDTLPVGFEHRSVWETADGTRIMVTYEASLIPRSPTDLIVFDRAVAETTDASGMITKIQVTHAANGEVDLQIAVERGEDGKTFTYEGTKSGKPLRGTFTASDGLASELWFARRIVTAKGAAAKRPVSHDSYVTASNPVGPTVITLAREAKSPRRMKLTMGELTVTGELDEFGLARVLESPLGSAKMVAERTWSRGSP